MQSARTIQVPQLMLCRWSHDVTTLGAGWRRLQYLEPQQCNPLNAVASLGIVMMGGAQSLRVGGNAVQKPLGRQKLGRTRSEI